MKACANCRNVKPAGGICRKGHVMDARNVKKDCKEWQKQDCINCQFLTREATTFYYNTTHRLWWIGRGNPFTSDRCEGCSLRAFASIKKTIEQVKRDTSDLFETVGCLSVEHVTGRYDLVSTLELIAESISTSTSKAGELSLKVREIERTGSTLLSLPPPRQAQNSIKGMIMSAAPQEALTGEPDFLS